MSSRVFWLGLILTLTACGGGKGKGADPVVEAMGIAYVARPLSEDQMEDDARELMVFAAGGDLYYRDLAAPGGRTRNLTGAVTGGRGDVRDLAVSHDGTKLLFALRLPEIEGADPEEQPTWNIWEYDLTSGTLRRVIASDITAKAGQDRMPQYLPDGRIVFVSTRQRQARARLLDEGKPQYAALDERRREPAFVLHVMEADGSDIRQLSFNQSHDRDPVVLADGTILFSRWDNMGSRSQMSLYRIRPDGTGLAVVYGAHSHDGEAGAVQFLCPRPLPDGRLLALRRPFRSTGGGAQLILIDIAGFTDRERPAPGSGASGTAETAATVMEVSLEEGPSPGGRFSAADPLWDGTSRLLVAWSPCRLQDAGGRLWPCTAQGLEDPEMQEAPPLYGLYFYDLQDHTQVPLLVPQEGVAITDVAVVQPRPLPDILADGNRDAALADEGAGILHIRSVYDFDGDFNPLGSDAESLDEISDPARRRADERPARFLRVVKAVPIPDRELVELRGTAFGRSSGQLMREIVAYAPIEPDGSVMIKVPADVPLAVSVLDRQGRRLTPRHQNWIQVRPGETLTCNGCHDHRSGAPHGSDRDPPALNAGAPTSGLPFPNTDSALIAEMGETMAQTRTRLDPAALDPSVDLIYEDLWTDETAAGRPRDADLAYRYADLATPAPVDGACQSEWKPSCRIVIHYETHIHPLWGRDRGADTCTLCHNTRDAMGNLQVPAAQLDLSDGESSDQPLHLRSYRELLFNDNEQEIVMGALQDRLVQATDAQGNPLFETDENGDLILDAEGNPIPVMVTVTVRPAMSAAGALASQRFFSLFEPGGSHAGRLEPAELRLIAEWLDIGAQYYNDPFAVPPP